MNIIYQSRRDLLKSIAATFTGWLLPTRIFSAPQVHRFHFLQIDSQHSWSVAAPVTWALENCGLPILTRAAEGLSKLTLNDADRIIRLVVRRCSLKLIELQRGRGVVDHWGSHLADLKPFLKTHGLVRKEIEVVLRDRNARKTCHLPIWRQRCC